MKLDICGGVVACRNTGCSSSSFSFNKEKRRKN
jgi:hypothetical protein